MLDLRLARRHGDLPPVVGRTPPSGSASHATLRAVKVATRITVASAIIVAIATTAYAYVELRARTAERLDQLEREARAVAGSLRLNLESQSPFVRLPGDPQRRDLERATGGWRVKVVPRARVDLSLIHI